jgi:hypothetical protein
MEGIFLWGKLELLAIQNERKRKWGFILKRRYKTVKKEIDIYYSIVRRWMK